MKMAVKSGVTGSIVVDNIAVIGKIIVVFPSLTRHGVFVLLTFGEIVSAVI